MRRFCKSLTAGLLLAVIMNMMCGLTAYAEPEEQPMADSYGLSISAESAILVDATSGRVLYEKNAEQQRLIASTTKIMTALVAIEKAQDLDAKVVITPEWAGVEGSSMYLEEGDEVSLRGLLYGLLLNSGNDAATALACSIGGDEASFVQWMNEYAAAFGMENTHFSNPHGLDAEDHYSTAHDMARLMVEAMKNETFREITHTRYVGIDGFELYYHNKLLSKYQYCISGKTGYTVAAGRTLVTASEKDGQLLVAVTLNAPDDWNDHIKLYDYGYSNYPLSDICERGSCAATVPLAGTQRAVPVYCTDTLTWLVKPGESVQRIVYLPDEFSNSVAKGAIVGRIVYRVDGQTAGCTYLIAGAYGDASAKEVSYEWKSDYKKSCLLAGLYPDVQPKGTYSLDGLLSTAFWHSWG